MRKDQVLRCDACRSALNERAAIREFDGGMCRGEAEELTRAAWEPCVRCYDLQRAHQAAAQALSVKLDAAVPFSMGHPYPR